jgi:hypothetical protein
MQELIELPERIHNHLTALIRMLDKGATDVRMENSGLDDMQFTMGGYNFEVKDGVLTQIK